MLKDLPYYRRLWHKTDDLHLPPHFEDSIGSTSHIFLIHSRQVFDGIFLGSYSDKTISIRKLRAKDSEKVHLEINRAECFIKSAKRLLRLMWYIQMKIA